MKKSIRIAIDSVPVFGVQLALAGSILVLVLLLTLHVLSPEFDPSWRMVSEYANGQYRWVVTLLFLFWSLSSFALAFSLRSQILDKTGKAGLAFLIAAGIGEGMAAMYDVNHSLHSVAALIGIGSFPLAALLLSRSLGRVQPWSIVKKNLILTSHLPWISVVLMAVTFALLIFTYIQSGGDMSGEPMAQVPPDVIAVVGWANRFLIIVYCGWIINVSRLAIQLRNEHTL